MLQAAQQRRLEAAVKESNLDRLFAQQPDFLLRRLEDFRKVYSDKLHGIHDAMLPREATIEELLAEYDRNPHRLRTLLQATAFMCSPEMLAMMWMVLLGSKIEALRYEYRRMETIELVVEILLPNHETILKFRSNEHWDTAVLKLAALSKVDDQPMIDDFHSLHIPRPQPRP